MKSGESREGEIEKSGSEKGCALEFEREREREREKNKEKGK